MKKLNNVVEERLLEVYKTENPSACEIENPNIANQHMLRHQRIYRTLLNFPEKMFQDARLLDVGAGIGEKAMHYTLMGANCDLVEFNDEACQRATHLFDKFSYG
jgi:ubiquinone/menaquinone biosynthesis C-methylase UbiE